MNNVLLKAMFAVSIGLLSVVAVIAQNGISAKPTPPKTASRQIDPKRLFNPQQIRRAIDLTDLGVKGAELSWDEFEKKEFRLDVIPVLTKFSKKSKVYALDKNGIVTPLTFTVEALDANGEIIEICTKELLGWTVEEIETQYPVCTFRQAAWEKTDRFRISADTKKLLKETNTKNNVIVVAKTKFTGKEYSTIASPLP